MVWFTRFTRFADAHLVYGQERGLSCGPASVVMCVAKIKKLSAPGAIQSEAEVRAAYAADYNVSADFLSNVAFASKLAETLNKLQCGTWASEAYNYDRLVNSVGVSSAFSGPIANVNPVILLIKWTRGGGHFVVVDTIREFGGSMYATVCDPWDADVHVQQFNNAAFTYKAQPQQKVNLWGEAEHIKTNKKTGVTTSAVKSDFGYTPRGSTGTASHIIYPT